MAGWGCTCAPDPLFSFSGKKTDQKEEKVIAYDENGEEYDVDADELEYDPYYDDPHYDQDEESF